MRVLIGCSYSGIEREAFRALGHDAWSNDLIECEDGSKYHLQCDIREIINDGWDMAIMHPTCTYLCNSGVRWLYANNGSGEPLIRNEERWEQMREGAAFFKALLDADIENVVVENPVMHRYARELIGRGPDQIIQPWWFGEKVFKATGHWRRGPLVAHDLVPTNRLTPPKPGTAEHRAWSTIHMASPGPDRWKDRSRCFPGVVQAIAAQFGGRA